ncbi:MAG: ATP synthase F1 subunit delta [Parachlamydiaceae bacterium]
MSSSEISSRYAKAFFKFACSREQLEALLEDFEALMPLLKKPSRFLNFFAAPHIDLETKEAFLKKHFKAKEDSQFLQFLLLLLGKRRFNSLPKIAYFFQKFAQEELGILDVSIVTAISIDEETQQKVRRSLEERFQQKLHFKQRVNAKLLGGGILMIGNKMIDNSIQGKLAKLRKHLLRRTA